RHRRRRHRNRRARDTTTPRGRPPRRRLRRRPRRHPHPRIRTSRSEMAPRLQPLPAMVRCLAIVAALGGVARADRFEPPASVPAAQDRYLHGKSLFAAKQFTEAANEFAAAYQLDSDAKFLLFDIALAHRMAGRCDDAIAAYRAFVDAHPPEQYLAAAKIGIDR